MFVGVTRFLTRYSGHYVSVAFDQKVENSSAVLSDADRLQLFSMDQCQHCQL